MRREIRKVKAESWFIFQEELGMMASVLCLGEVNFSFTSTTMELSLRCCVQWSKRPKSHPPFNIRSAMTKLNSGHRLFKMLLDMNCGNCLGSGDFLDFHIWRTQQYIVRVQCDHSNRKRSRTIRWGMWIPLWTTQCFCLQHIDTCVGPYRQKLWNLIVFPRSLLCLRQLCVWYLFFILRYLYSSSFTSAVLEMPSTCSAPSLWHFLKGVWQEKCPDFGQAALLC